MDVSCGRRSVGQGTPSYQKVPRNSPQNWPWGIMVLTRSYILQNNWCKTQASSLQTQRSPARREAKLTARQLPGVGLDCQRERSEALVRPSGTDTRSLCRKALPWTARHLFTLVWERWREAPKPARPISLRVKGETSGLGSTCRRASRGEGHQEHPSTFGI